MNKGEFINTLVKCLHQETGREALVQKSEKLNHENQEVLTIRSEKVEIRIGIDGLWDVFLRGKTISKICNEIVLELQEFDKSKNEITPLVLSDWKTVKSRVRCRVYSKKRNQEMAIKNHIPYYCFLDFIVTFFLQDDKKNEITMTITENHLQQWNISKEELLLAAKSNMKEDLYEIVDLKEHMKKICGIVEDDTTNKKRCVELSPICVILSKTGLYGASAILNNCVLENTYKKIGCNNFYILPSSVYELIIVSDSEENSWNAQMLKFLVMDTNNSCVKREDQLTNSIYYYNHEQRSVKILV